MTAENIEPIDGLDTPALVTSGIVAAIGTFALIVALQVVYLRFEAAERSKNLSGSSQTSAASLMAEQRSKLNRYGWIDRQNDVVAIPIDLAIELTASEYSLGEVKGEDTAKPQPAEEPADQS
jgi:hypothetical protein